MAKMDRLHYEVRPTLFSRLQRYALDEDALEIDERSSDETKAEQAPKGPWRIPLASIHQIRLEYAPGRYQSNRFECQVWAAAPGPVKRRMLVSLHCRGLADFVDQADAYAPFVRALCQRAAAKNPQLAIVGGYSPFVYYIGLAALTLVLLGFVVFLVAAWDVVQRSPRLPLRLLLLGGLLLILFTAFRRNRPRRLTADALPAELLPKTSAGVSVSS